MKIEIPTDTIIDARADLDDDAKQILKVIYLASPALEEAIAHGVTPTEVIYSVEQLRQAGFVEIVSRQDKTGETRYELRPRANLVGSNRQAHRQKIRRRRR